MNDLNVDIDTTRNNQVEFRKKRVKIIKRIIVITVLVLLLLPTLLCVLMFIKLNKMEERIEALERAGKNESVITNSYESVDLMYSDVTSSPKPDKSDIPEATKTPDSVSQEALPSGTPKPVVTNKPASSDTGLTINTDVSKVTIPPVEKSNADSPKRIYLTFDEGPSDNTERILDILKKYNVKATFFVNGKTSDMAKAMYKRIVAEGHTLAMHSYSHDYDTIYKSVNSFAADLNRLSDYLYQVTGVRPKYYRFPGGSSNSISNISVKRFINYLTSKNIKYYDWNVQNSDAQKRELTKEELTANVINGVNLHKDSIVLMHDAKSRNNTVESLPMLIELLLDSGAQILPIDDNTPNIVHVE